MLDDDVDEVLPQDRRLLTAIRGARHDGAEQSPRHHASLVVMVEWLQGANRACDGKARFGKPEHAAKAATDCTAKYGDVFAYYPCPYCGGYHLHVPANRRKPISAHWLTE